MSILLSFASLSLLLVFAHFCSQVFLLYHKIARFLVFLIISLIISAILCIFSSPYHVTFHLALSFSKLFRIFRISSCFFWSTDLLLYWTSDLYADRTMHIQHKSLFSLIDIWYPEVYDVKGTFLHHHYFSSC